MSEQESLERVRKRIDEIDQQLVELLNLRAKCAVEIGHLKDQSNRQFFTPEREFSIFQRLRQENAGPLTELQLKSIYREIISAARAAEKPLKVAYWGPPGTFSNLAAHQTFGSSTEYVPAETIPDVFLAVEQERVDYGVVPVENSTAGVVPETLDMFPQTNVKICAETNVDIHHHLVSLAPSLDQIKTVYAGPQPSQQCKRWLRMNLPWAEVIDVAPTTRAVERAQEDPSSGAIANKLAIELTGMPVLAERIEDTPGNRTRFLVIGYNEPAKTGSDKTSVMFSLRNQPGELYKALGAFVTYGINLLMIESRPAQRSSFEYNFYVDCSGHRSDANIQSGLDAVKEFALDATVLGSYPSSDC